jgi:hypothetical protein
VQNADANVVAGARQVSFTVRDVGEAYDDTRRLIKRYE